MQEKLQQKYSGCFLCISNAKVATFLSQFGKPLEVLHKYCEDEGFQNTRSGNRLATLQLEEGISKNNIPHVIEICNFSALTTVVGRRMKCLRCKSGRHKFKNCPQCQKNQKTFAEAAKNPEELVKSQEPAEQIPAERTQRNLEDISNLLSKSLETGQKVVSQTA